MIKLIKFGNRVKAPPSCCYPIISQIVYDKMSIAISDFRLLFIDFVWQIHQTFVQQMSINCSTQAH